MRYGVIILTLAALTFNLPALAAENTAAELLKYVPEQAEFVAGIDMVQARANGLLEMVQKVAPEKFLRGIENMESTTGIEILQGLRGVVVAGELKSGGASAIIISGQCATELLDLVSTVPTYDHYESLGVDLHSWRDDRKGTTTYATFWPPDVLAFSESMDVIHAVAEAGDGLTNPMLGSAKLAAAIGNTPPTPVTAFVAAFRPAEPDNSFLSNPLVNKLNSGCVGLQMSADTLTLAGIFAAQDTQSAPLLTKVLEGALALAELQFGAGKAAPLNVEITQDNDRIRAMIKTQPQNFGIILKGITALKK